MNSLIPIHGSSLKAEKNLQYIWQDKGQLKVVKFTVKANILPDIYLVGAATDTTILSSGRDSMRFRRLWSYSETGIPGVRSSFLTRKDTEYLAAWRRDKDIPRCGWDWKTGWPYPEGFVTMFLVDNRVPARRNEVNMKKTSLTLTLHISSIYSRIYYYQLKNTLFTVVHRAASFSMPDEHLDLLAHLPHQQGLWCLYSVLSVYLSKKTLTSIKTRGSVVLHWRKQLIIEHFCTGKNKITFSINLPIPLTVRARPPKTWVASIIEGSC